MITDMHSHTHKLYFSCLSTYFTRNIRYFNIDQVILMCAYQQRNFPDPFTYISFVFLILIATDFTLALFLLTSPWRCECVTVLKPVHLLSFYWSFSSGKKKRRFLDINVWTKSKSLLSILFYLPTWRRQNKVTLNLANQTNDIF